MDMEHGFYKDLFRQKGLKVTGQRLAVLETLASHPGEHFSAEEIYELAKVRYPEIGLATIYRTVQMLSELSLLDKVSFDDGYTRYELCQGDKEGGHHHHHAICRGCGAVISFEHDLLENLEQALFDHLGFVVDDHEVKLYGYCKHCAEKIGGNIFEER